MIEPSRYADGRAMLLAGLRRQHSFADASTTIPAQWADFRRLGEIPGRRGASAYGVICGAAPERGTMEYMCGVEVDSFEALPAGLGRLRVPPDQRYAVFLHQGGAATVQSTWEAIFNDWLPRSGHQSAHTPDFEVYDERFDPETGTGTIEIWFPIQR